RCAAPAPPAGAPPPSPPAPGVRSARDAGGARPLGLKLRAPALDLIASGFRLPAAPLKCARSALLVAVAQFRCGLSHQQPDNSAEPRRDEQRLTSGHAAAEGASRA